MHILTYLDRVLQWSSGEWRTVWSFTFKLTEYHLSEDEVEQLCEGYDELGSDALDSLYRLSPGHAPATRARTKQAPEKVSDEPSDKSPDQLSTEEPRDTRRGTAGGPAPEELVSEDSIKDKPQCPAGDLFSLLEQHASDDEHLSALWTQINEVPDWVDWAQLKRGQDTFHRYGAAMLTGLFCQSLLGGLAAPRIVETLSRTGGFSINAIRRRVMETSQWVLECMADLESIQPGGRGWKSTVRVRLIHAAVRKRILSLAATRPEYYSVEEHGIPINDLHTIVTICSFSTSLMTYALPSQGIFISQQEEMDFVALWRYLGYIIGCPVTPYFSTVARAKAVGESAVLKELTQPSRTSRIIADNMVEGLAGSKPNFEKGYSEPRSRLTVQKGNLVASARWLNGNAMSDALGLMRPSLSDWLVVACGMTYMTVSSYVHRSVPSWDRKHIEVIKKGLWKVIVESDFGLSGDIAAFDFKHVPELDLVTAGRAKTHEMTMADIGSTARVAQGWLTRPLMAILIVASSYGLLHWLGS